MLENAPKFNTIAWLMRHHAYNITDNRYLRNKKTGAKGWPRIDLAPTRESMDEINQLLDWGEQLGWKNTLEISDKGYPICRVDNKNAYGLHEDQGPYVTIDFYTDLGNFIIRLRKVDDKEQFALTGSQAFFKFKEMCTNEGIDLDGMSVPNGEEIKLEIKSPLIGVNPQLVDTEISAIDDMKIYHIDFHSAYPGALKETHPEFAPIINTLYSMRKEDETMKAILNLTVGYFQSQWCLGTVNGQVVRYAHADLARDAINTAREKLEKVTNDLRESGAIILAHNTDGVWYLGKKLKNHPLMGKDAGQFGYDYEDCQRIRFRSKGAYEFIDKEGKYHPVVRGRTKLDFVKSRAEWEWGDIYNQSQAIVYSFKNGRVVELESQEAE